MPWTTPGTATAGEVLTASFWNTQVRDNMVELAPLSLASTSWTPQIDQGTNTNIAKTLGYGKYLKVGKYVFAWMNVSFTGAGQGTNAIICKLPLTGVTGGPHPIGNAIFFDASITGHFHLAALKMNTTDIQFLHDTSGGAYFGASPALTIASGDGLQLFFCYEAA
jgi:hypothetical protein